MNLKHISEIAKITGIKHETLRMWIHRDKLKAQKIGRDWFIDLEDIKKVEDRRKYNNPLKTPQKEVKYKVCPHGTLLPIGICKHGCKS